MVICAECLWRNASAEVDLNLNINKEDFYLHIIDAYDKKQVIDGRALVGGSRGINVLLGKSNNDERTRIQGSKGE